MSSPNHPALRRIHHLDRSSARFHGQLSSILYGKEYQQCLYGGDRDNQQHVLILQRDDLKWLVSYLDKACATLPFPVLDSFPHSLSMVSSPPVQPSGSIYANSETYAARVGYSHGHARFRLPLSRLVPNRLPQVALVMCTREPSTVQRFASNVCECILITHKRLLKCALMPLPPPCLPLTRLAVLLSRDRDMETVDTPKHCTTAGCHYQPPPAHFTLDDWWGPAKVYQE